MKFTYDKDADAAYLRLRTRVKRAYGRRLDDSRYVDYGEDGEPIGVELLNLRSGVNLDDLPGQGVLEKELRKLHIKVFA